MFKKLKKTFIGDKAFYRTLLVILLPLVIQQGFTSFVNMLDTLMVGSLGEESLSAVGVVNQILMVFNLTLFGGLSGISIFGRTSGFCSGANATTRLMEKPFSEKLRSYSVTMLSAFHSLL